MPVWNPQLNFSIIDVYDPGDYSGGWEYTLLTSKENQNEDDNRR